ncbi:MAG: IS110 family transposase [Sphingobacteriales bacterium]|nr:MAG: IS110 family transposase [Sphingobacteriales bacterium]
MQIIKQVVGVDVGNKELVLCLGKIYINLEKHLYQYGNFRNTPKGLEKMYEWVLKHTAPGIDLFFAMEATGVYHEKLAYFLEGKQCNISIILPNKISNYSRTLETKTTTDKTSSEAIALFGLERNLDLWHSPDPLYKTLKQLTRERDQLVHERSMVKNQIHAEKSEAQPNDRSLIRMEERVDILDRQENEIQTEIRQLVQSNAELKDITKNLTTIPGIALLSAVIVLAETNGFDNMKSKKQLVSYAGLDVKEKQSGTSVNGKPTISKRGNRYLRKAMHLPSLTAIRLDPNYKAIYARLVGRHGIKMKAAVAIQRKMLELMFIIHKTKRPYDPQYHLNQIEVETN